MTLSLSRLTTCYDLTIKLWGVPPRDMSDVVDGLTWLHDMSADQCPYTEEVEAFLAELRELERHREMADEVFRLMQQRSKMRN
jgi:aminoglycoside phosphotransferase